MHAGDWELITAGQRVQLAKSIDGQGRISGFGTEVVLSSDGTLAAVLGASPGASASVSVVLDLLAASFPQHFGRWLEALRGQLPHLGTTLNDDPQALAHVRAQIAQGLKLDW
ncbi:malate:quinone oxidoreductase [Glutamicibacter halophytocola]|uniref:malate:quinone oxidoreductase n=1 Tax=Glutamicibacter halophytocola TaxID=1933880 RepID=UPI003D29DC2B